MSIHRKGSKWVVRYRDGERNRSKSFNRKADAERYEVEVTRRRQLGALAQLTTGNETLDAFVTETWAPTHGVTLAPKTRRNYAGLYDHHIAPALGLYACVTCESRRSRAGRPTDSPLVPGR